jgi:hypothetical protein
MRVILCNYLVKKPRHVFEEGAKTINFSRGWGGDGEDTLIQVKTKSNSILISSITIKKIKFFIFLYVVSLLHFNKY